MCAHATPDEARRCECTGYGFGDLTCRCGQLKSDHENGTGRCVFPAARCHEFVVRFVEPFPVTTTLVGLATDAVMSELGADPGYARDAAMAVLFAGRRHALERDHEIETVRAANNRLRAQVAALTAQLEEKQHG
jgi:hypothetical protein